MMSLVGKGGIFPKGSCSGDLVHAGGAMGGSGMIRRLKQAGGSKSLEKGPWANVISVCFLLVLG